MEVLKKHEGKRLTFTAPSGRKFTIREQNGDDDDILSAINPKNQEENLDNINLFISAIVTHDFLNNKNYLPLNGAQALILKDKYYILLKSRIHSNGPELVYEVDCRNKGCGFKMEATENLIEYDADFSKPYEANGFKFQITPHSAGNDEYRELTLSSDKKIRYKYMTGLAEQKVLEITKNETRIGRNLELIARSIEVQVGTLWQPLSTFNIFSSPEMGEIRKDITEHDKQWNMVSEIKCPQCNTVDHLPLTALSSFFYPSEI